jgi:hypothetical protein
LRAEDDAAPPLPGARNGLPAELCQRS